jgi:hypothetical protein
MRDLIWVFGGFFLFALAALPWWSIYDWVRKQRGKKYKSREDVV